MPTCARGNAHEVRRRVRIEAAAWGLLGSLTTAFVAPLLIARGAGPPALGIYTAGVNLFGLGMAWLGPWFAARSGRVAQPTLAALVLGRSLLVAATLLILLVPSGAIPLLLAALILWAAGEGVAQPLWTAFVVGLAEPDERGRWIAWRATVAAKAVAAALPLLVLLSLVSAERAMQAAFAIAAAGGLISALQLRTLFAAMPEPPIPPARSLRWPPRGSEPRFLAGVFGFWFGAALNRPVLPPHLVHDLGAPPAYFAAAAVAAALAGLVAQPRWGRYAEERGTLALLWLSGLGASAAPLLWTVVPSAWIGLLVEIVAAGCWLGHLLGLTLRAVELAADERERAGMAARTSLAQGGGGAIAPLVGAAAVGFVGTTPVLVASGLACLAATALLAELRAPAWLARLGDAGWLWSSAER